MYTYYFKHHLLNTVRYRESRCHKNFAKLQFAHWCLIELAWYCITWCLGYCSQSCLESYTTYFLNHELNASEHGSKTAALTVQYSITNYFPLLKNQSAKMHWGRHCTSLIKLKTIKSTSIMKCDFILAISMQATTGSTSQLAPTHAQTCMGHIISQIQHQMYRADLDYRSTLS